MRIKPALAMIVIALGLGSSPSLAVEPDEILADPVLEGRARTLSSELRCLVCQNQSIDDSNAPLAKDLRLLVRERLKAGDSDAAIRAFLVDRYGAFVLLRPPITPSTVLLWSTPVLLVVVSGWVLWRRRRTAPEAAVPPLSAEEVKRLDRLTGA